jgi:3-hydroxyisobutyrate dehydrogenase
MPGAGLRRGMIVIDCSTVGAGTARDLHARLGAAGVGFLDCPVSGGVEGARTAALAIMVGGDESVFGRAQPILEKMGKTIAYMGPSGAGQAAKATNQIMCAGIIQAVGRGHGVRQAEGLPLDRVIDTLGKGAGSSWYFVNRAPFMATINFPPDFACGCMRRICASAATWRPSHGARCPWSNRRCRNMPC